MADVFEDVKTQTLHKLVPPVLLEVVFLINPIGYFQLGKLTSQIHQSDGDNLGLPLQTQRRTIAIIDKCPRHLHHGPDLLLIALERLGILEQVAVRVIYLQIEFNCLQQDSLVGHDVLEWIVAKTVRVLFQILGL